MTIENLSSNKSFGGWHKQYSHHSETLNCSMRFAIYLPPQASNGKKVPALYWLSGLTGVVPYLLQDELVKSGADEQPVASVRMMIDISRPN